MSDEMVQEKTELEVPAEQNNGHTEPLSGEAEAVPVSSPAAAPATTEEPAPAPPAAVSEAATQAVTAETVPVAAPAVSSAPAAAEPAAPAAPAELSDEAAFDQEMLALDRGAQYDKAMRQLQENEVITGTVMRVDREGVLVDVGAKSEGIIRLNELSRDPNIPPESIVKIGDKIKVYVLQPENQDGIPVLSKKRADFEQAWDNIAIARDNNETLTAMVTDRVKGGLVVDLGIRGFVPASHVGNGSLKNNLDRYVGQQIQLKVIEVDKERRKVVLSNKQALDEDRASKSHETKSSLAAGQIRHGVVRRLTNYGAFIDLGGIDGLLHISEMSWTRINDPKEILREGQDLDVIVLKMDLENNRVSLGLRQILPDPWTEIGGRYKEGDTIVGTVTRLVPFGAFVQVEGGVEGIIPNAELPRNRGGKTGAGVNQGEEVTVKVIGLRPEERKMTLSIRALLPPEERESAPAREPSAPREGGPPREGAPAREGSGPPREGSAGKRERSGRGNDRDREEDFGRFTPGRATEEPRYSMADAFNAARKTKRDRRPNTEEEEYVGDIELEDDPVAGSEGAESDAGETETVETNTSGTHIGEPAAAAQAVTDEKSE